jgi:hypothetical protein
LQRRYSFRAVVTEKDVQGFNVPGSTFEHVFGP